MASENFKRTEKDESPSKRHKPSTILQNFKFAEFGCEMLFIELLQGGYEIIILEESLGQDGFLQPIRDDIKNNGPLSTGFDIVRILSRKVSSDNDAMLMNTRSTSSTGNLYPRVCIVRLVESSDKNSRKTCLEAIALALNNSDATPNRQQKWAYDLYVKRQSNAMKKYVVPPNFDLTPSTANLRKMGNVFISRAVVEFIQKSFSNVTKTWASENQETAKEFFDHPYPSIAKSELGYPEHAMD
jgi:hypothetical protein